VSEQVLWCAGLVVSAYGFGIGGFSGESEFYGWISVLLLRLCCACFWSPSLWASQGPSNANGCRTASCFNGVYAGCANTVSDLDEE